MFVSSAAGQLVKTISEEFPPIDWTTELKTPGRGQVLFMLIGCWESLQRGHPQAKQNVLYLQDGSIKLAT